MKMRNGHRRGLGRQILSAMAEASYPDRLGHAFHNFPAEEAWVGLALLLPPADHVPSIGFLVGAGIQESLEVQAMLLQKAQSISDMVLNGEEPVLPGTASLHGHQPAWTMTTAVRRGLSKGAPETLKAGALRLIPENV